MPTRPWDRRKAETDKAWLAFVAFRDLPPGGKGEPGVRTIENAIKASGKSPGQVRAWERWCTQHDWRERVRAWDAHLDARRQRVAEESNEEAARRHVALGRNLQSFAGAAVARRFKEESDGKGGKRLVLTGDVKPGEAAALARAGVSIEREARGMATGRLEVTGEDGGPVRVEVGEDPLAAAIAADPEARAAAVLLLEAAGKRKPGGPPA